MPSTLFTPETARAAQKLAAKLRVARREAVALERLAAVPADLLPLPDPHSQPSFRLESLARTRRQIRMIASLIDAERDPSKLDRLTAAIQRLYEAERVLDGRPLPGQRRPAPDPAPERPPRPGAKPID